MADFLQTVRQQQYLTDLQGLIKQQLNAGNITEAELLKIIDLIKNTSRLKRALKFL